MQWMVKIIRIHDEKRMEEWWKKKILGWKRETKKEKVENLRMTGDMEVHSGDREKCSTEEENPFHLHINMEFNGGLTINIYNLSGMTLFLFGFHFLHSSDAGNHFAGKKLFAFVRVHPI